MFEYDEVDRLERWQRGEDFEIYEHDLVGNRSRLEEPQQVTSYSYDVANRLLSKIVSAGGSSTETSYTWNADGQQTAVSTAGTTASFNYDLLGQMIDASTGGRSYSYGYDALGRRVKEEVDGSQRHFLLNGPNVVSEITDTGDRLDFTHGPWVDEVLGETFSTPSDSLQPSRYYHHDDLGSVTAWSDESGALDGARHYSPFGSVTATQGGIEGRYGFTGREDDETGLYYYRARYYAPELGRFTSVDPVGSSFLVPRTLNGFDYAFSNPGKYRDPSGASPVSILGKILLGLLVGAVVAVSSVACVQSGSGLECVFTLFASFTAAASTSGYLIAWGLAILGLIFLAANLWISYRDGQLSALAAIFLFVALGFIGYNWAFFSWLFTAALASSFNLIPGTEGVVALVLLAAYAAFAFWAVNVVSLKTEISL